MTGLTQFTELFGAVTVADIVQLCFAVIFLYGVYRKFGKYIIARHESEKKYDEKLNETLDAIHQYPEYRKQSLEIQKKLESQINELREAQELNNERLAKMEDDLKRRERNKLRARLLESYRFYTNPNKNPSGSWTRMEAEAFWELFHDYEDAGGDGYMHSEVQPAMERLTIEEME